MKNIILSRKGFDSSAGGVASPIFDNGNIFSIPIPQKTPSPHKYKDLFFNGISGKDLLKESSAKSVTSESYCHFDPLLTKEIGIFGQANSSQTELKKQHVNTGDLFLFFGWFKQFSRKGKHLHHIFGWLQIDKVVEVNQQQIGKTPRSNPATYTGLYSEIRKLFSDTVESKIRGYKPGRFSFNVSGGRCETCKGGGMKLIEMNFLPDVFVECEVCNGKRFNRETLEVRYKGKSISDVLEMTVEEGYKFFDKIPAIKQKLQTLMDVGLDYIKIGQSATTLSGGEAQRIKLSKELSKRSTGKTLYILDEPTTGLHFDDVKKLLKILHTLVDEGNTVIVIEHNLDVIKTADHIIDLGPLGGVKGGQIVGTGTPEDIANNKKSFTGEFLKKIL